MRKGVYHTYRAQNLETGYLQESKDSGPLGVN